MDYNFQHFLEFSYGMVEVFEPEGFDASNFVIQQESKRWGRDTFYGNDEISLVFGNDIGEPLSESRTLDNGMLLSHLNSGLDLLLKEDKENGSESIVNYILKKDGVDFSIGQLDFGGAKTDGLTYFECKIIQNNEQAKIKRREKIKVDAFSDKDLDGNTITPIQTQKMLLRAKPIDQKSEWIPSSNTVFSRAGYNSQGFWNHISRVVKYKIENTLSWFSVSEFGDSSSSFVRDVGKSVFAVQETTNVKINIKIRLKVTGVVTNPNVTYDPMQFKLNVFVSDGSQSDWLNQINNSANTKYLSGVFYNGTIANISQDITVNIPVIPVGKYLYIVFQTGTGPIGDSRGLNIEDLGSKTEIKLTSTAIDSVIDTSRYIDLIKQNYKAINANSVIAPKFDVGGIFYDQFCFSGKMIRQKLDEPFYLELTKTNESILEVAGDYQINKDNVYIGQYTDYYPNYDLGGFLQIPDKDFNVIKNEAYLINKFTYGYEKYEKDRDEDGTLDAIHTDSEWYVPNNQSQNEKKISNPFIRDAYNIESVRRRATSSENTSYSNDDDIFIVDAIPLAPNSRNEFTAVLKYQKSASEGTYKILSTQNFRWDLLGFSVGDTILISEGGFIEVPYVVSNIEPTILTMAYGGADYSGETPTTINYPLTNVAWVNRTNQGLFFAENLLNSENYSNLRYSIKRNMSWWFPYLSTCSKFITNKLISNSYFKANGECTTQFTGEIEPIKENEIITILDIGEEKILSQNVIKTTVIADFEQVKTLVDNIQRINEDDSIGGFVRVQNQLGGIVKGYVQKLDYTWATQEAVFTLEEKNEIDFLTVTYSGGILTINEVGYSERQVSERIFNIFNDSIQFIDNNNVFLCNRTHFSNVKFNGNVYNSADELAIAIQSV